MNMLKLVLPILFYFFSLGVANSQWASNYSGYGNGDLNVLNAKGLAIAVDNSGNCYVTGYVYNQPTGNDIVLIKYNADGDTLWTREYNNGGYEEDKAFGVIVDAANNIYITGQTTVQGRGLQLVVLKYNQNGQLMWSKTWGATNNEFDDAGVALTLDETENNLYVTGYGTNNDSHTDLILQKYGTSNGYLKFTKKQDGGVNMDSEGHGIVIDAAGYVYTTGFTENASQQENIITIKFNSSGTKQWQRTVNGNGNNTDKGFGIVTDDLDNVYVTGYVTTSSNISSTDAVLLKYTSTGSLEWSRTYNGEGNVSTDKAWGIVVDESGNIIIAGQTTVASNGLDYLVVKYGKNGYQKWVQKYNGTGDGDDCANAIALTNNNKIVVTGASWGTNQNFDYATIRIHSNGNINGVSRYSMNGSTNDIAKDVKASHSSEGNNIYVTGYSELLVEGTTESCSISTVMLVDDTKEGISSNTPSSFSLHQNYPNPFNPSTTIKFEISNSGLVKLVVYDMLGKTVDILVNQNLEPGSYSINYTNKNLSSGVYFYELTAGDFKDIKKMSLIK
jgi:uncharacterized delta-60 repeat protein